MDQGLDSSLDGVKDEDSNINISDVIEVIQTTDPDFKQAGMFSGGGEIHHQQQQHRPIATPTRRAPYVKIIEQPASKALRFRYECEGRSAGSIPGASSTPENKTFPAIQVVGYQGKAIVVVSCVTKDEPYKPHPHNLVGREGCRRGVCTLEIQPDTMAITFSNLGIQCVKKKDIEEALRVREEIRVDPFRTGFAHRNQPTSIDLNAVRLCFQVFLEGETRGKFNVALPAVVSDPIYDKKAMSDLVICRLSHCSGSVLGGDEVILLCEKVAKEDINIRFYEEKSRILIWEALADFQPSQVHKQVAIAFKTPNYHNREISEPVDVFIQLRRPSDGATSESHTFTYIPTGRPTFWSYRRALLKKGNYSVFNSILAADCRNVSTNKSNLRLKPRMQNGSNQLFQIQNKIDEVDAETTKPSKLLETNLDDVDEPQIVAEWKADEPIENIPKKDWCDYSEIEKISSTEKVLETNNNVEEKSLNDLLNQVAELDEIYSDTRERLLNVTDEINSNMNILEQKTDMDIEAFDDTNTYSSLQLAFKNPIEITLPAKFDDIVMPQCPIIDINPQKRENESEKLPPLPPKRIKKTPNTPMLERITNLGSSNSVQMSQNDVKFHSSNENIVPPIRSASFSLVRPTSQEHCAPSKKLPPTPVSTLPNPKKQSFFSKLFTKKTKKDTSNRSSSSEDILDRPKSASLTGASLSNVSDCVDRSDDLNKQNGLLKDDDILNLDLTEAEHYALYTAMAPHATQSEFDEMSCYYSPVEGGKVLAHTEIITKLQNT